MRPSSALNPIHIATAGNAAYFPGLEVLVSSALLHARPEVEIHFHIFGEGITEDAWRSLQLLADRFHARAFVHGIKFDEERLTGFPTLHGNKLTYARLLLSEYLPKLEKIIYLDCDIFVARDLGELVDFDLQGRTAAAADDPFIITLDEDCPWLPREATSSYRYFNAGVLVLDLRRWRGQGYTERCLAAISAQPTLCRYHDQSALNYLLRDDVVRLSSQYNTAGYETESVPSMDVIFHLGGPKPWLAYHTRFDHLLWRAFYEEAIDRDRSWPRPASGRAWFFHVLAGYRATRWIYRLIMRYLIRRSTHQHQRRSRELALLTAFAAPALLERTRCQWRAQIDRLGTPRSPRR